MPGTFTAFFPVDAHSAIRLNGKRFDRETIAWLAPNQMFHIDTDRPTKWMSVTIPVDQIKSCLTVQEYEAKRESRSRTRNFCAIAGNALASLTRMASELFAIGTDSPDSLQDRATESAARTELIDATLRTFLPLPEATGVG